jgi:hypothetical protein
MLALAFLTAVAAAQGAAADGLIPATVPELRRLFALLLLSQVRPICEILRWSHWRRRHQARARQCHYQRRSQP